MKVCDVVFQTIEQWSDRIAVAEGSSHYTYGQLGELTRSIAGKLSSADFSEGDRAILWLENSAGYIASYLAVLSLRGIVTALHPKSLPAEVLKAIRQVEARILLTATPLWKNSQDLLNDSGLDFVFTETEIVELAGSSVKRQSAPEGLAQIVFTSGTTGQSKGVMLSHINLVTNTRSILKCLPIGYTDSIVSVLPYVFVYGNSIMLTHLFAGGKLVIQNNFAYPGLIIDRMKEESTTGFSGVASNYAFLLRDRRFNSDNLPSLRYFTSAGGIMPSELLRQMKQAFPEREFYVMYGQTEATARLTILPSKDLLRKYGTAGIPIPGVSLKIVKENGVVVPPGEVGEIAVSGDNVMKGYWMDPEGSAKVLKNGYLHTGDLGYLDEEGYLFIRGRRSEMIKSGAYRISPTEIEDVLLEHPDVHEAGVVGVEDPIMGESIVGLIVAKTGKNPTRNDLLAHAARKLPSFKRPKAIFEVPELPKSTNGKVLRQPLRELAQQLFDAHTF